MRQLIAIIGALASMGWVSGVAEGRGVEEGIDEYLQSGIPVDITFDDVTYQGIPFLAYTSEENESGDANAVTDARASYLCEILGYGDAVSYGLKSRVRKALAYGFDPSGILVLGTFKGESRQTITKEYRVSSSREEALFTATVPAKTWAVFTNISCSITPNDDADDEDGEDDDLFFDQHEPHVEKA